MGYTILVNPQTKAIKVFAQGTLSGSLINQLKAEGYTTSYYSLTDPTNDTEHTNRLLSVSSPAGQQTLAQLQAEQITQANSIQRTSSIGSIPTISETTPTESTRLIPTAINSRVRVGIPEKVPEGLNVTQKEWDNYGIGIKRALLSGNVVVEKPTEVSPEVYAQLGSGLKERGNFTVKTNFWQNLYGTAAPLGSAEAWKAAGIWGTEALADMVPGVYTAKHWDEMPAWEKGLNVFVDVAVVAMLIKPTATRLKAIKANGGISITKIVKATKLKMELVDAAKAARNAREDLKLALSLRESAQKAGMIKPVISSGRLPTAIITRVHTTAIATMRADERFIRAFASLKEIHPKDLRQLEKISGFTGLEKGLKDINVAQKLITKEWAKLDRLAPNSEAYMRQLTEIQKAHDLLDVRYETFSKVLRPEHLYKPTLEAPPPLPSAGRLATNPNYKTIKEAIAKAEEQIGDMSDDTIRRLREVIAKEKGTPEERTWEFKPGERGGAATKERIAPKTETQTKMLTEEELNKLTKEEKAAIKSEQELEAAKREYETTPRIEEEIAKRKPSKFKPSRDARGIAAAGAEQAITWAIGRPLYGIETKTQLKTATEINEQYQRKLQDALNTATNVFTETYTRTGNLTDAETAAQNAIQTETKTQNETKTDTIVDTQVKTDVDTILRTVIMPKIRLPIAPPINKLKIERVEGIPPNPGVISYEDGVVKVTIPPPYRTEDIGYDRLLVTRKGKGTQEATLKVTGGKAPRLVELSRGIDRTSILRGKHMTHSRQRYSQRGPGILDRSGRLHKQRRGSVIQ